MASASSTAIPSFSSIPQKTHDVFISFRGEDTRNTFTAHLLAALKRLRIITYVDNKLERGDEISPTLLRAIEKSTVSVIVFSRNYATSKWCLEELVKIIECKRTKGQIVIPVFYYVDPSNVRYQTGSYADAFAKHEQRFKGNMQKVQQWRASLTEAANLSGWDCLVNTNRIESQLVEEIAEDILQKLSDRLDSLDIDSQIRISESLLRRQNQQDDVSHAAAQHSLGLLRWKKELRDHQNAENALRNLNPLYPYH